MDDVSVDYGCSALNLESDSQASCEADYHCWWDGETCIEFDGNIIPDCIEREEDYIRR